MMEVPDEDRLLFFHEVYARRLSDGEKGKGKVKTPRYILQLIGSILRFIHAEATGRDKEAQDVVKYIVLVSRSFCNPLSLRTIRVASRTLQVREFHEIIVELTDHSNSYFVKPRTPQQKQARKEIEKAIKKTLAKLIEIITIVQKKSLTEIAVRHLRAEFPEMFLDEGWAVLQEVFRIEDTLNIHEE